MAGSDIAPNHDDLLMVIDFAKGAWSFLRPASIGFLILRKVGRAAGHLTMATSSILCICSYFNHAKMQRATQSRVEQSYA